MKISTVLHTSSHSSFLKSYRNHARDTSPVYTDFRTTLPSNYYTSDIIYKKEMNTVWSNNWLFGCFADELRKPGSFITVNYDKESVLLVKDFQGSIRGFHNICRHRGSRLILEESGQKNIDAIVCPYHCWNYDFTGKLIDAKYLDTKIKNSISLLPVEVEEIEGLIFFSDSPKWSFSEAKEAMSKQLKPQLVKNTKIAYEFQYEINANWKVVMENNRECYHCPSNHKEYSSATYDTAYIYEKDPISEKWTRVVDPANYNYKEIRGEIDQRNIEWKHLGIECSSHSTFTGQGWYRSSRCPLRKGFVTESIDGKRVCKKLLNSECPENMGSGRIHTFPNFWIHISSDHAVATRLLPKNKNTTIANVYWLVNNEAKPWVDYDERVLSSFWHTTSIQDWMICERVQKGIESNAYIPGPLVPIKEYGVQTFLRWYMEEIGEYTPKEKEEEPKKEENNINDSYVI